MTSTTSTTANWSRYGELHPGNVRPFVIASNSGQDDTIRREPKFVPGDVFRVVWKDRDAGGMGITGLEPPSSSAMTQQPPAYTCTFCGASFRHAFEWRRHETAVHCPHLGWTCMATGPVTEDDECVFCSVPHPGEGHLEQHRVSDCLVKRTPEERKYHRKDLLLQHIRAMHLAKDASKSFNIPDSWKTDTEPLTCHPVWCGFCQETFRTTAERMDHVAKHFQDGLDMRAWVPPPTSLGRDFGLGSLPADVMDMSDDPTPSRIDDHASLTSESRNSVTPGPSSEANDRIREEVAASLIGIGPSEATRQYSIRVADVYGAGEQFAAQTTQPKRSHITPEAREILTMSFERNRYPDVTRINELAQRTGLSAKAVRNWMSNRRARPPLEDEAQPKCGG
jgi:hypothetical protein